MRALKQVFPIVRVSQEVAQRNVKLSPADTVKESKDRYLRRIEVSLFSALIYQIFVGFLTKTTWSSVLPI